MTSDLSGAPPQAIILSRSGAAECAFPSGAYMRFQLRLGEVADVGELTQVVSTGMMFPHEASGLDAVLDLMSDLDWFGSDAGYVVELHELDQLVERVPDLLARFVALLPNLCDRWRSRDIPSRVILRGDEASDAGSHRRGEC